MVITWDRGQMSGGGMPSHGPSPGAVQIHRHPGRPASSNNRSLIKAAAAAADVDVTESRVQK